MNLRRYLTTVFGLIAFLGLASIVYAQDVKRVSGSSAKCGDIVEGEFTSNYQEDTYKINLKAGDTLDVSVVPFGVQLNSVIIVNGPTNLAIAGSTGVRVGLSSLDVVGYDSHPIVNTGVLAANGIFTIRIDNFSFGTYRYSEDKYSSLYDSLGIGAYTLNIGCTLRDGTVINPGDTIQPITPTIAPIITTFSGTGFPGLAPVDFANAFTNDLTLGQPAKSKIPPAGDAVLGYTFDAAANDNLALSFTRVSGNLNLGLVVLSADNKVVFQASLVTSSELTTKFTLPSAGTYTIGIFRIDLLPPDAPEATAFQLTATLNP